MLFNLYGYRLVIRYLHSWSTVQLSVRLDKNIYDDASLISIKTPLLLPYYTNSETYERVDGEILIDGEYYNYVKRRIFNDSLELLCLPNSIKSRLDKVEAAFSKSASGSTTGEDSKKATIVKNVLPEFCENNMSNISVSGMEQAAAQLTSFAFQIPVIFLTVYTPPPNIMHGNI